MKRTTPENLIRKTLTGIEISWPACGKPYSEKKAIKKTN